MVGATPIFCDITHSDWGLDLTQVRKCVNEKTKAIIAVHLYGRAANIEALSSFCSSHNIFLIEDAAQGVGVKLNNRHVGTFGCASILSFYGNKTITCGEGGVVLTNNSEIAKRVYQLKNHGRSKKGTFIHESIGYNYSFTEMQAAIGIAQLNKLEKIIRKKAFIRDYYQEALEGIFEFTALQSRVDHVHWFTTIKTNDPEGLSRSLSEVGVGSRRIFYPLHLQPCYAELKKSDSNSFPVSSYIYNNYLSLPSSFSIKRSELDYTINALKRLASTYA